MFADGGEITSRKDKRKERTGLAEKAVVEEGGREQSGCLDASVSKAKSQACPGWLVGGGAAHLQPGRPLVKGPRVWDTLGRPQKAT